MLGPVRGEPKEGRPRARLLFAVKSVRRYANKVLAEGEGYNAA